MGRTHLTYADVRNAVTHQSAKSELDSFIPPETGKLASIEDVKRKRYADEYVTIGILYRMLHYRHDQTNETEERYPSSNKKQKKDYNRIFMFGDTQGKVFCIICQTDSHSSTLMAHCKELIGIGTPFVVVEPHINHNSMLKVDMATITTGLPIIPMDHSFVTRFPIHRVTPPSLEKEETYFVCHNQKLTIASVYPEGKADMYKLSCSGKLCDRKMIGGKNQTCGCFNSSDNWSSFVLQYSVQYAGDTFAPEDFCEDCGGGIGRIAASCNDERSLRTTELFMKDGDKLGPLQRADRLALARDIRKSVKKCVDYINANGGFTIVGTAMVGVRIDENEAAGTRRTVMSEHPTFHAAYVMPTDSKLPDREDYKKLKYDASNMDS
jgi:hypothetical protein